MDEKTERNFGRGKKRASSVRFYPLGQPGAAEMIRRISEIAKSDRFFFYPYMPLLPTLIARTQVSQFDLFIAGYTIPSQYFQACVSVLGEADWVVIDRHWADPLFLKKYVFPAMANPHPKETDEFEQVLDRAFVLVDRYGTFDLRHRVLDASPTSCAPIME
jgi:hypothetical protein